MLIVHDTKVKVVKVNVLPVCFINYWALNMFLSISNSEVVRSATFTALTASSTWFQVLIPTTAEVTGLLMEYIFDGSLGLRFFSLTDNLLTARAIFATSSTENQDMVWQLY
jgi:hypothetical protein